ncbi:hypothetical protein ROHU_018598 [Labeo rohita]|uniref:Uncharacterized protein n=1 Tax=Labeo rohita TaxID=84645 RepID=A0A498N8K2_LABRO|nr:hypothetical protein ROHU_018598 [Labeo rohita]
MSFLKEISPLVKKHFLSGNDVLLRRAAQITAEIQQLSSGSRRCIIFLLCHSENPPTCDCRFSEAADVC